MQNTEKILILIKIKIIHLSEGSVIPDTLFNVFHLIELPSRFLEMFWKSPWNS